MNRIHHSFFNAGLSMIYNFDRINVKFCNKDTIKIVDWIKFHFTIR